MCGGFGDVEVIITQPCLAQFFGQNPVKSHTYKVPQCTAYCARHFPSGSLRKENNIVSCCNK